MSLLPIVVIQVNSLCRDIKHYHMQARFLCVRMRIICVRVCECLCERGIPSRQAKPKAAPSSLIQKRNVGCLGETVENVSQQRII